MATARPWLWLPTLAAVLAGCVAPPYAHDAELKQVLNAYRQQAAQHSVVSEGIRNLSVEAVPARPGEYVVSGDFEGAPLGVVVRRMLEAAGMPYLIGPTSLHGRVTARFDKQALQPLLRRLLEAHGYVGRIQDGFMVVSEAGAAPGPIPTGTAASAPGASSDVPASMPVSRSVRLRYLDIEMATKFLDGVFPVDQRTGARPITWAAQPYTSTMFLSGAAPDVTRAMRLLDEMDRDPTHVLIEVLIIELDTNELERYGADLVNYMGGELSALSSGLGGAVVPGLGAAPAALRFMFTQNARNRLQYEALFDVLAHQDKARIIARPFMAAVSGKQAAIQIQRERTVAVVTGVGGQVTSDTETIPSGVILTITPWALEDGRVRLDVQVEQSNFLTPESASVLVEKDANKAQTSMQVRSGQSMVIGGLALRETSSGNSGLPWLRHIPLLNLLAAKQTGSERKQDVMVFVTPYIWTPAVDPPIPMPGAFKFEDADDLTALERWKRRWIKP